MDLHKTFGQRIHYSVRGETFEFEKSLVLAANPCTDEGEIWCAPAGATM